MFKLNGALEEYVSAKTTTKIAGQLLVGLKEPAKKRVC